MRLALITATFFALATTPAAAQTLIEPGAAFMIGGEQAETLRVAGRNIGAVPVALAAERGGAQRAIATVAAGDSFAAEISPGEIAVFTNASGRQAKLDIALTPALFRLSMRYREAGARTD